MDDLLDLLPQSKNWGATSVYFSHHWAVGRIALYFLGSFPCILSAASVQWPSAPASIAALYRSSLHRNVVGRA
ncbi:hypothetical protein BDQ12DRAFT_683568, partial [Crucibulum laeve]